MFCILLTILTLKSESCLHILRRTVKIKSHYYSYIISDSIPFCYRLFNNADFLTVDRNMWCSYLLTSWCRVLLEKLTGLYLVKKFPAFHGTRRFITALTSLRHLSLSWTSTIQSIYPTFHLLEIHSNIIHPSTPSSKWCSTSTNICLYRGHRKIVPLLTVLLDIFVFYKHFDKCTCHKKWCFVEGTRWVVK